MERGELDRDSRVAVRICGARDFAKRPYRVSVRLKIIIGIRSGARGLAQHVERVRVPGVAGRLDVGKRLAHRLAGDELSPHDLHRLPDCGAYYRLARTRDQVLDEGKRVAGELIAPRQK